MNWQPTGNGSDITTHQGRITAEPMRGSSRRQTTLGVYEPPPHEESSFMATCLRFVLSPARTRPRTMILRKPLISPLPSWSIRDLFTYIKYIPGREESRPSSAAV